VPVLAPSDNSHIENHRHKPAFRSSNLLVRRIAVVREVPLTRQCCPWRMTAIRPAIQWGKFTLSTHNGKPNFLKVVQYNTSSTEISA